MTSPVFPLPTPDVYGPALGGHTARQAVQATLQTWTPSYIAEVAKRLGLTMGPFQHWVALPEYRALPQNYAAACWATCTGTRGTPERRGDGTYRADYLIEVSTLVYGGDWDQTEDLTSAYNLAARMALLQHRSLGDVAVTTVWQGETYTPVSHTATRTLGCYRSNYLVTLDPVATTAGGPTTVPPAGQLPPTPPTVATEVLTIGEPLT